VAEQGTHKPLVGGSNPPSATTTRSREELAEAVSRGAAAAGLPRDAHLVVAVSGGPDSTALLHGAARLVETGAVAWRLTAAHLDHALRPESADDGRFVADACAALGIEIELARTDVAELARAEGRSIEEAGRIARYRLLERVAGDDGWIATGHTADDSAETVLINLMRGSGTTGLRGIPARRGRIVRPLLGERRERIRSVLDSGGIAYRVDASNEDPAYLRNRVRRELLPLMETIRPGAVARLIGFAALAADEEELLDAMALIELGRRQGADGDLDWRDPPNRAVARRVLRRAAGSPPPSAERIEALLAAASGDQGGVTIELGAARSALVRGRRIRIRRVAP
jgi:tRNA(Ile)-lysidine synthase